MLALFEAEFAEGAERALPAAVSRRRRDGRLEALARRPAARRARCSRACAARSRSRPGGGRSSSSCAAPLPESSALEPLRAIGGEQSNSSVVFGERAILKVYRRLEAGESPELELLRFLAPHGFEHAPRLLGWYRYAGRRITATLGILQAFVPDARDGWAVRARLVRRPRAVPRPAAAAGRGHGPHARRARVRRRSTRRSGRSRSAARRSRGCARGRGRRPRAARRARPGGPAEPVRARADEVLERLRALLRPRAAARRSASTATTTSARCCGRPTTGSCSTSRASRRARSPSAAARARRCATSPACCARSPTRPRRAQRAASDGRAAGSTARASAFLSGYDAGDRSSLLPARRRGPRRAAGRLRAREGALRAALRARQPPRLGARPVAGILRLLDGTAETLTSGLTQSSSDLGVAVRVAVVASGSSTALSSGRWRRTVSMYDATAAGIPTSRRAASDRNQRCSRISWNSSAASRLPRSSAGTAAIDGLEALASASGRRRPTRARPWADGRAERREVVEQAPRLVLLHVRGR